MERDQDAVLITPRRAATRQWLLTAAAGIFAERGMHGASVEDICEAAGFTRGAFYSNFADKQELFATLHQQEKEQVLGQLGQVIDQAPAAEPTDVIEQLVENVLAVRPLDRQSHLVHTEFSLYAIRNRAVHEPPHRDHDEFRDELARLLQVGLARAGRRLSVAPHDAVDVVIATFEMNMTQMLICDAPEHADSGLVRRTLPLIIRAFSEPAS